MSAPSVPQGADVLVDRAAAPGVTVLRLNRPGALNAIRPETVAQLAALLDELESESACRAVVVAGNGRAFCSGADVKVKGALAAADRAEFVATGRRLLARLRQSRLVSVAALHGYVLGGGLELALSCDVRVAADDARFGFPEVGLGHLPGWDGAPLLARVAGAQRATHLLLTGERLDAARAAESGVVDEVVRGDVVEAALGRAARYAEVPADLVAAVLGAVRAGGDRA